MPRRPPSGEDGHAPGLSIGDPSWEDVARQLAPARNYWLSTTGPGGAPHAAPVWGAVVDGALYLYSERSTAKARNVARDARAVVHLESGDDVLIVHGHLDDVGHPSQLPEVLDALAGKYAGPGDEQYLPTNDPAFDVVYRLAPKRALLWTLADWEGSQRRWTAPG